MAGMISAWWKCIVLLSSKFRVCVESIVLSNISAMILVSPDVVFLLDPSVAMVEIHCFVYTYTKMVYVYLLSNFDQRLFLIRL